LGRIYPAILHIHTYHTYRVFYHQPYSGFYLNPIVNVLIPVQWGRGVV